MNQKFILKAASRNWRIIAMHSYKAIAPQTPKVVQAVPTDAPQQRWRIDKAGDDTFTLRAETDGMALTALTAPLESKGADTAMLPPDGSPAQAWKLIRVEPEPADFASMDMAFVKSPPAGAPAVSFTTHSGAIPANLIPLDLVSHATADSRQGLFLDPAKLDDTVLPLQFGILNIKGIPFNVPNPTNLPSGKNLIVLRNTTGYSKAAYPKAVELPVNDVPLSKLHIIGGVAGWGWPYSGKPSESQAGAVVAKITVHRTSGLQEHYILRNGDTFCDFAREMDVPGSARIRDFAAYDRHARFFTLPLTGSGPVKKIALHSGNNHTAPVFVAITGEK